MIGREVRPKRERRFGIRMAIAFVASCVLVFASMAEAQGRRGGARDPGLQDTLLSVDVTARTVTVGDGTFPLAEDARLIDERGGRMRLAALAKGAEGREVLYRLREVRGDRGRSARGGREVVRLELMEGDFE